MCELTFMFLDLVFILFPQLSTRVSSVSIVTRLLVDNPELDFR
jgi:hypothetical protein